MISYFQIFLCVVLSASFLMGASATATAKGKTGAKPEDIECFVCNSMDDKDCKKDGDSLTPFKTKCKGDYFKKLYGNENGPVGSLNGATGWGGAFPGTVTAADAESKKGFVQKFVTQRVFFDKDKIIRISDFQTLCRKIETKLKKGGKEDTVIIRGCAWGQNAAKFPKKIDSGENWGTDVDEYVCKNEVADKPCNNGNVLKSMVLLVLFVTSFSLFFSGD